ncbi:MAG: DNA polymerase III subunit alpha, partial [Rhodospirillales bacterium]|nr:DNA polymerase III subunit alpha [Rhodospirillales bacterium]
ARLVATRNTPFVSVEEVWRRSEAPVAALQRLADADAFASLGLDRRAALWAIRALRDEPLPLFAAADARDGYLSPEIMSRR